MKDNDAIVIIYTMTICALASTLAIRVALKVDPGAAIGHWTNPT